MTTGCRELLAQRGPHSTSTNRIGDYWYCGAPGGTAEVRLSCPAGRGDAVGGPYCEEHGGHARANAEARANWNVLAPECVGGAYEVQRVGCWTLSSRELYVVIRPAGPRGHSGHDRWTVALGIGGYMEHVAGTWDSALLAERASIEHWRRAHDSMLARIKAARGGTLDWGLPTYARDLPFVVSVDNWEPGTTTSWGAHRDPLPEALAAPLVPPRLSARARRQEKRRTARQVTT